MRTEKQRESRRVLLLDIDSTLSLVEGVNEPLLRTLASLDEHDVVYAYSSCAAFQAYNDIFNACHVESNITRARFCDLIQRHSNGKFRGLIGSSCMLYDDLNTHGVAYLRHELAVVSQYEKDNSFASERIREWLNQFDVDTAVQEDSKQFVAHDMFIDLFVGGVITEAYKADNNYKDESFISNYLNELLNELEHYVKYDFKDKGLPDCKIRDIFRELSVVCQVALEHNSGNDIYSYLGGMVGKFKEWLRENESVLTNHRFVDLINFMHRIHVPDDAQFANFKSDFIRSFRSGKGVMLWHLMRHIKSTDNVILFDDKHQVIQLHQLLAHPANKEVIGNRGWHCFQVDEREANHNQRIYQQFLNATKQAVTPICWTKNIKLSHLIMQRINQRWARAFRVSSYRMNNHERMMRYLGVPMLAEGTKADMGFDMTAYVLGGFVLRPIFNCIKLPLVMLPSAGEEVFAALEQRFLSRDVKGTHRVIAKWVGVGLSNSLKNIFKGCRFLGQLVTSWSIVPALPSAWRSVKHCMARIKKSLANALSSRYDILSADLNDTSDNIDPLRLPGSHLFAGGQGEGAFLASSCEMGGFCP